MDAGMFFVGGAVVAGFVAVLFIVQAAHAALKGRGLVLASQGRALSPSNLIGLQMQRGVGIFMPVARLLQRNGFAQNLGSELASFMEARGWKVRSDTALSCVVAALLLTLALATSLSRSLVAGIASALCVGAVMAVVLQSVRDRRKEAVRQEMPAVLELMSACFGSGFTLLQTFQQISIDMPGPLGSLFGRSAHILETGGTVSEALDCLRSKDSMNELGFVVAALDIQRESGGSLKQVLATASKSVKEELALRRSLRVQTAQAKLSARIVTLMPFILIAVFCLVSPDFLQPFFSSLAGICLLALAVLMQAAGILLVQRALNVEGVS